MKKLPDTYESLEQRLQDHSEECEGGCREWRLGVDGSGYGRYRFRRRMESVHRLSWEIKNGPIPLGMQVLHRCDNPPCLNIEHLFLGTQKENIADMNAKNRQRGARGAKNASAKLNPEKVFEIRWLNTSGWTWRQLADEYGVDKATIGRIVSHKTWTMECHD